MRPRDVSVSIVSNGGKLYINATFQLEGELDKECQGDNFVRVSEKARKAMQKQIQRALEGIEL